MKHIRVTYAGTGEDKVPETIEEVMKDFGESLRAEVTVTKSKNTSEDGNVMIVQLEAFVISIERWARFERDLFNLLHGTRESAQLTRMVADLKGLIKVVA